ncbi:unnamed protein product [Fusarium equiseti]|uniref:Uncharacterized protein n=1 Tax=Fusarium equiseti TaxID=61235 RepID=A0A8J2N707_FUSEQ|nr:unnamed protein product [Fusarium equiseti]
MAHPILFNTTLPMSLFLFSLGLNASFRPEAHLKALEFPLPKDAEAKKFAYALMRIWGIRNISVGLLLTLIWATGDEKLMAKAMGVTILLPVADGFVSRIVIGGGETQHWVFPPLLALVSAGLFGWF